MPEQIRERWAREAAAADAAAAAVKNETNARGRKEENTDRRLPAYSLNQFDGDVDAGKTGKTKEQEPQKEKEHESPRRRISIVELEL